MRALGVFAVGAAMAAAGPGPGTPSAAGAKRGVLYTVGTGNGPLRLFMEALKRNGVRVVVDIRSKPYGWNPDFNRGALREALAKERIGYEYLGGSLGGFVEGGFERHRGTAAYRAGLDALEKIAERGGAAILCAEGDPLKCHRLAVGADMEGRGWKALHILWGGSARATADLPRARNANGGRKPRVDRP